jgi:hypothetical protein
MSKTTLREAIRRAGRFIPAESTALRAVAPGVCTPPEALPRGFQAAQRARNAHYLSTSDPIESRRGPAPAPAFIVTYQGMPIAWVAMDGSCNYPNTLHSVDQYNPERRTERQVVTAFRLARQVQHTLQVAWGDRVYVDSMGTPRPSDDTHAAFHLRSNLPTPSSLCAKCVRRGDAPELPIPTTVNV